jgi:hypothetical protein
LHSSGAATHYTLAQVQQQATMPERGGVAIRNLVTTEQDQQASVHVAVVPKLDAGDFAGARPVPGRLPATDTPRLLPDGPRTPGLGRSRREGVGAPPAQSRIGPTRYPATQTCHNPVGCITDRYSAADSQHFRPG